MSSDVIRITKCLSSLIEEYRSLSIKSEIKSISVYERDEFLSLDEKNYYIDHARSRIESLESADFTTLLISALNAAIYDQKKYVSTDDLTAE